MIGDINITELSLGPIDLTNPLECQFTHFNVFEDLYNPYGPSAEIFVNDFRDALGRFNFNGKEDVKIAYNLVDSSGSCIFDMKCHENKNLDDRGPTAGSLKSKMYEVRCISPEYLNAQTRGNIQKSYNIPIAQAIEDLVKKTGFMSNKGFLNDDPTKGPMRHVASGHPINIYQQLNNKAVSVQNKSSAYVLFVQKNNYRYCTIEQLCKAGPVADLVQRTTTGVSGTTYEEKLNTIMDIKVNTSFFTPPRVKALTGQASYNRTTGKANLPPKMPPQFKHLGNPVYRSITSALVTPFWRQKTYTQNDSGNNKTATGLAEAVQNRAAYMGYLAQNEATVVIPGNPKIVLGSIVNLTIPNKSTESNGTEKQFSGLALVTEIKHMIKPFTTSPRYQMVLKVTKAGGYDQGGE